MSIHILIFYHSWVPIPVSWTVRNWAGASLVDSLMEAPSSWLTRTTHLSCTSP